jgi:tRNA pseudouridine38-40 synthase
MPSRNVKLVLRYDGTDFSGWQIQPNARTVQGVLAAAIAQVVNHPVRLTGAGRTDAGVHALGQVANFSTESSISLDSIWRGANSLVRPDIRIDFVEKMSAEFDARRDAVRKMYRYTVAVEKFADALRCRSVWSIGKPLDVERMRAAADMLVGEHDFSSFRAAGSNEDKSPVRTLESVVIKETDPDDCAGSARTIVIEATANGFLYKMVRNIVGTLVACGHGILDPDQVRNILEARDRALAPPTAPPHGLCLIRVEY